MEAANNCRRVVSVRYMCAGQAGCAYYKQEKGRRSFMRQHCEYRCYRTDECLSGDAKAAADVAAMASNDNTVGANNYSPLQARNGE